MGVKPNEVISNNHRDCQRYEHESKRSHRPAMGGRPRFVVRQNPRGLQETVWASGKRAKPGVFFSAKIRLWGRPGLCQPFTWPTKC